MKSFLILSSVLLTTQLLRPCVGEFNFEVGLRVNDRLSSYMSQPYKILDFVTSYQTNGGLTSHRDAFLSIGDALMQTYPHWMIYYGLDNGELAGNFYEPRHGNYREPGNGGYDVDGTDVMQKHFNTCIDEAGNTIECLMNAGDMYIDCVDGCALKICDDEESKNSVNVKWCRQYEIKTIAEDDPVKRGYVPLSYYCLDKSGLPSQAPGEILEFLGGENSTCTFDDGVTPVDRKLSGTFAYCEGLDNCSVENTDAAAPTCSTTFVGAFRSMSYDPRYRPWYINARNMQKAMYTQPFAFWEPPYELGITFINPFYEEDDDGKQVFNGVVALDYKFTNIANFLTENYDASTIVAVVEEAAPHYIIATSTGVAGSMRVLSSDTTQPCPADGSADCQTVRVQVDALDNVISRAFVNHVSEGFPQATLLPVEDAGITFVSQTIPFSLEGIEGINWRIMIISPIQTEGDDAITAGDSMLAFIIAPSILGFTVCSVFFGLFFRYRKEREVVFSDWRFTNAFIFGCMLLNLACLSFIGENTDSLCILRMWLVPFFFVLALTPLLAKTYRMYLLVGRPQVARQKISHHKTALYTVPFLLFEVILLLVFTFVDPSQRRGSVEVDGFDVVFRVTCATNTRAFFAVQVIYLGGLVLIGCILAYKTRNMQSDFGESKQLILSMYHIALVGAIVLIVANVVEIAQGTLRVFITCGVAWTTIFSAGVFVLPRLLKVKQNITDRREGIDSRCSIRISGLSDRGASFASNYGGRASFASDAGRPSFADRFSFVKKDRSSVSQGGLGSIAESVAESEVMARTDAVELGSVVEEAADDKPAAEDVLKKGSKGASLEEEEKEEEKITISEWLVESAREIQPVAEGVGVAEIFAADAAEDSREINQST